MGYMMCSRTGETYRCLVLNFDEPCGTMETRNGVLAPTSTPRSRTSVGCLALKLHCNEKAITIRPKSGWLFLYAVNYLTTEELVEGVH